MGQAHPQNPPTLALFLLLQAFCYPFSVTNLSYLGSQEKGPFPFHGLGPQKGEGEVCMISSRNRVTSWSPHFWTPVTPQNLSGSSPAQHAMSKWHSFTHGCSLSYLEVTLTVPWVSCEKPPSTRIFLIPPGRLRTAIPQLSWNTGPSSHSYLVTSLSVMCPVVSSLRTRGHAFQFYTHQPSRMPEI